MRVIRRWFIAGLVVLLPVIVTIWALAFGFNLLDGLWRSLLPHLIGRYVPGVGALLTVTLTVAVGAVATNVIGRRLIGWGESLLERIPVVRSVYSTAKQIVDVLAGGQKAAFQRVVLVEYPRRGLYTVGFVTSTDAPAAATEAVGEELWSVFVPTSPNPTSGWVVMLPRSQCRVLHVTVDEAFRYIISGGVLTNSTPRRPGGPPSPNRAEPVTGQTTGNS
ncbi:DUF502 domain-containing protein [Geochorda subterranea]|uniref:DUF502 domain-containing protein n=1 Tax=Geochorda subterranea TaxID=3109564 RepID=A0ABZ1BQ94_9FIRM|nr:DUF502 domain-containing protein [Limnochorda sp. LNt]WRP14798.1 DUF502 domain-containing protein [Limnochorda sp. LNt]